MNKINNEQTSWLWYVLIGMYLLYYTQASLFPGASIIGQVLIFLILFIGLKNLVNSLMDPSLLPVCTKWILFMLIVLTISYILSPKTVNSILLSNTSTLGQFKNMLAFFLPVFTGFQIGLHKQLTSKQWTIIAIIIFAIAISSFYEAKAKALQIKNLEETTNNSGYIFLYILPFMPLILKKYKVITITILSACFIFVMVSAKRGAIICMACMSIYLLWWYLNKRRISFGTIATISLLIIVLIIGVDYIFTENDYLQQRFEATLDGNASGRDYLYARLWDAWLNADLITQLFGRGIAQTVTVVGNYAHNDWLELLTDVGLCGTIIYLMLILTLLKFRKNIQTKSPERAAFMLVIILWLIKTVFSMGIEIMGGINMMLIGTIMGNIVADRKSTLCFMTQKCYKNINEI